jgi:hypothetical protein
MLAPCFLVHGYMPEIGLHRQRLFGYEAQSPHRIAALMQECFKKESADG